MKQIMTSNWVAVLGLFALIAGCAPGPSMYSQLSPVAQGTVVQYLLNPHGNVDGLLLADGTQVQFPPHMEDELVAVVQPNDPVTVQGYRHVGASAVTAYVVTNTHSGRAAVKHEPSWFDRPLLPPHMRRWFMREMAAEGRVRALLYAPRGEVHGVVLEDGTQVRIPPHARYHFSGLLQVGQSISAVGYGTENRFGRVLEAAVMGAPGGAIGAPAGAGRVP